jgi:hypothetical protein
MGSGWLAEVVNWDVDLDGIVYAGTEECLVLKWSAGTL